MTIRWGSGARTFGRFGGGWNYVLGFQLGTGTLIINLLVTSIRIDWARPKKVVAA